jgi:hypothetical protein
MSGARLNRGDGASEDRLNRDHGHGIIYVIDPRLNLSSTPPPLTLIEPVP